MSVYGKDTNDILKLIGGSTDISKIYHDVLDLAFPVGSIYMSVNSTSPATLFGGTWERLKDRFLLGAGDSYSNGSTGGEINVTITSATMPAHGHSLSSCTNPGNHSHDVQINAKMSTYNYTSGTNTTVRVRPDTETTYASSLDGAHTHTIGVNNTGGGGSHNNMPPYHMVYIWRRTT